MKFAQAILAFATISGVLATSSKNKKDHDVQTANFKFHGDHSGSYKLSVKADGKEVETGTSHCTSPYYPRDKTKS